LPRGWCDASGMVSQFARLARRLSDIFRCYACHMRLIEDVVVAGFGIAFFAGEVGPWKTCSNCTNSRARHKCRLLPCGPSLVFKSLLRRPYSNWHRPAITIQSHTGKMIPALSTISTGFEVVHPFRRHDSQLNHDSVAH
jgi:hypothetical protein